MTHIVGLTALDPLGRSRTEIIDPSASCVVIILAPPLSCQPVPSKLPGVCPGISVYQLLSWADRNGCVSSGFAHADVSIEVVVAAWALPAASAAMPTAMQAARRARTAYFMWARTFRGECWQPSHLTQRETSGFASPTRAGFAFSAD